jgi:NAD(P)-dependent dehydrogenase (short-subunit alcohol dehydrogenase family)
MKLLEGKTVLVTGAGRGIGRAHALEIARHGARLVVNDIGSSMAGTGADPSVAEQVVAQIETEGGTAIPNHDDISSWAGARRAVRCGIDAFGSLDGLLNNAGILRAADLADLTEDDFDALVAVHLKGSFACTVHALAHWRDLHRAGQPPRASVVNTFSEALMISLPRYGAYSAVKAGIVALTTVGSREAEAYGVRLNAYGPRGLTRMAVSEIRDTGGTTPDPDTPHPKNPGNSSPLVIWLLSDESAHVTGQLFQTVGGGIAHCEPWVTGPMLWPPDGRFRFNASEVGPLLNSEIFRTRVRDAHLADPPGWPTTPIT